MNQIIQYIGLGLFILIMIGYKWVSDLKPDKTKGETNGKK